MWDCGGVALFYIGFSGIFVYASWGLYWFWAIAAVANIAISDYYIAIAGYNGGNCNWLERITALISYFAKEQYVATNTCLHYLLLLQQELKYKQFS